ncbi:SDR family oxidoreductase [Pseudomonas protegens]|uniref:SDR family oxidoreductase n=1 Tax=Pseudomonas protegens TaxID=380021 RepID=UPI0005A014D6|nr:SDR family oxidoreductase [Pseudomonas protegens]MBP5111521.1 SDR family oxidoreductase [Pseudomonas protegens]QTU28506.1 SDR family oxidoreductase [Pseudomonas protegens]QTU32140.1 SDR family oxidoreductase [Pseudomonas protegens]RLO22770.1 SDR family oxidoreductase [Pseudomonas protegens]VAV70537.1 putative citronellol/citronellal dehydrogenase AtuB [Pseudomonas protegens CHA0]
MVYDSIFKAQLFAGQTIIVTGSGSGIGRCTAHELAALGAQVLLVGRKAEKLQKVAGEIAEDGGKADWQTCDIRDEEAVKALVARLMERFGPIHGLVNNAGGQYPAPLASINQKGFETVLRTNLVGGFLMAREVFNQSMSRHGGSIVNMLADMWGGMPGMGHSGAARSGMDNFTKTAAYEWGHAGVRVNAVAPGWIASSGMDTYEGAFKAVIPTLREHVPLKRIGSESEVSAAIVFLLSPGAAFISGSTLRIDGAASLGSRAWPLGKARNSKSYNGFHRAYLPDVLKGEE